MIKQGILTALITCWALLLLSIPATAQQGIPEAKVAIGASLEFLELLDESKIGESWETASTFFQKQIPKQRWIDELGHTRPAYGPLQKRLLRFKKRSTELEGAPPGEYYVVLYATAFELKSVIETVTLRLGADGQWRVAGYDFK